MGNSLIPPCIQRNPNRTSVTLIFWDASTKTLSGSKRRRLAGEIMFEFQDMMVCHADSFFINHPIQALAIDDELVPGQTYFVLPVDRFAYKTLTTSSLAAFKSIPERDQTLNFSASSSPPPFEYLRGSNGRLLIKVSPEFIKTLIEKNNQDSRSGSCSCSSSSSKDVLCSTPELKKHYEQLVGSKEQVWSPKLETISEHKIRVSPSKFIRLEWRQKETAR